MKSLRLALGLAAAAGALAALPAAACTVAVGYRAPTNLELAAGADLILLGRVTAGPDRLGRGPDGASMVVEPVAAIKGLLPGQPFALPGLMVYPPGNPAAVRSEPLELERPHPNAFAGACNRYTFPAGSLVLFFLDRQDGEWISAAGVPFVRWAEDVPGEDAPWVQLARFYARVAELPQDQRTALLEAERDALLARTDDPAAQAMGADVARQLAAPAVLRAAAPPPDDGFRRPGDVTAVEQALDAMRADRDRR